MSLLTSVAALRLLDDDFVVGVDADARRQSPSLCRAIASASSVRIEQRARRGERVVAARADAHDFVVRLEHVALAGQHQALVGVGDDHHGFEAAEIAVGAPVLGKLDAGALELIGEALELGLKPLEQGEGVGGGAGEPGDDVAVADAAHLLGVALDDGLAEGDLAVAGDHHLAALADGEDRRPCQVSGRIGSCACTRPMIGRRGPPVKLCSGRNG